MPFCLFALLCGRSFVPRASLRPYILRRHQRETLDQFRLICFTVHKFQLLTFATTCRCTVKKNACFGSIAFAALPQKVVSRCSTVKSGYYKPQMICFKLFQYNKFQNIEYFKIIIEILCFLCISSTSTYSICNPEILCTFAT